MPLVTLTFPKALNTSLQVGDTIYHLPALWAGTATDTFRYNYLNNGIELGIVTAIRNRDGFGFFSPTGNIEVDVNCISGNVSGLAKGSYIMFSKDKSANTSGIAGYYAKIKLTNSSTEKIELFSLGSDISINSQ